MKIMVPSPKIELYKTGFANIDILDRGEKGRQLSDLIERAEDPLVIAVDGEWGSGKSFFLKCWVGAHKNENEGTAEAIYFDAFQNDFLDDPLISLTSAITAKLETEGVSEKILGRIKTAAAKIWRPALRIGLATATAGGTEVASAIGDTTLAASQKELDRQIDNLWKKEAGHRAAMAQFREALIALTENKDDPESPQKIVIAIDELDRCRPDYALSVLEVLKHFFDVPNVHFLLGVNLRELANSVRARYGDRTDAERYLQKFITLNLRLPNEIESSRSNNSTTKQYFDEMAKKMSLSSDMVEFVGWYLERPAIIRVYSLRSIERLLTEMALVPQNERSFDGLPGGLKTLIAGLIVLKTGFPSKYSEAFDGILTEGPIYDAFEIPRNVDRKSDNYGWLIAMSWSAFLNPSKFYVPENENRSEALRNFLGNFGDAYSDRAFGDYLRKYTQTISLGVKPA